jgi:Uma2 family endonuclease
MSQTSFAPKTVLLLEEEVRIPASVHTLAEFRRWCLSDQFPQRGRIDFLRGNVEVELSPGDIYNHEGAKTAVGAALYGLVVGQRRGHVFVDGARVVSPAAGLSVEPDVVVVLSETLASGRIREVPSKKPNDGRYLELEGPPDVVVEVISKHSVAKDRRRLPALYARAGVPELWLLDARGEDVVFEIWSLEAKGYVRIAPDSVGWTSSPVLGVRFRLRRDLDGAPRYTYELEIAPAP